MSVSIIITAFKEPQTIGKAIKSLGKVDQLLLVAPDRETRKAARNTSSKIKILKDRGKGKPAALNLAFRKVKGDIVVLTDGDVWLEKGSVKHLIRKLNDKKVGIVSGRPVPINKKDNLFGFWAYLLTEAAHQWRSKSDYFDCSGYLLAIRKELFVKIPLETLAEDAYLSRKVYQKGFKAAYAPKAKVYVKFPTNFSDWLKQKVRSVGGAGRGWRVEIGESWRPLLLCRTPKQFFYFFLLLLARTYLWLLIFWKLKIKKQSFGKIWQRVESTK